MAWIQTYKFRHNHVLELTRTVVGAEKNGDGSPFPDYVISAVSSGDDVVWGDDGTTTEGSVSTTHRVDPSKTSDEGVLVFLVECSTNDPLSVL